MLKVVKDAAVSSDATVIGGSLLDQLARDGARQMLASALLAEVAAYVEAHADQVDSDGHRLVVRNGFHAEREVTTVAGAVAVKAPRINDKRIDEATGERCRFSSAILPAWARKSPKIAEVLPLLYLHGLSSSDFTPALEQFLGSGAGLSASVITRLTKQWQDEQRAFNTRSLTDCDYVYMWVDGLDLKVRLEQDKVCLLVMIGVRSDGRRKLISLADGRRESTLSRAGFSGGPELPPRPHSGGPTHAKCGGRLSPSSKRPPTTTAIVPKLGHARPVALRQMSKGPGRTGGAEGTRTPDPHTARQAFAGAKQAAARGVARPNLLWIGHAAGTRHPHPRSPDP